MKAGVVKVLGLGLLVLPFEARSQGSAGLQTFSVSQTVPFGLSTIEGNSGRSAPFNSAPGTGTRYQQIYSANDFPAISAVEGAFITHLLFRVDTPLGNSFDTTLPQLQVNLSTTSRAVDGLSLTFEENVGPDHTIVFGPGPARLAGLHVGGGIGPQPWIILLELQARFFYDPSAGNLLLDVRNLEGGVTSVLDAQDSPSDGVSRISGPLDGFTASIVDTSGLVTLFQGTPVPEPNSTCLFALALVGAVIAFGLPHSRRSQEGNACRS